MADKKVKVIGAGLAGCEAAWQLARGGVKVELYDMKPGKLSPAHTDKNFAEVVCSNSFKSESLEFATGLLKEELRVMGSLLMDCAGKARVPAGGSLAVDRKIFAENVTQAIKSHPNITVIEQEVTTIDPSENVIIATGPLTSGGLISALRELTGESLYFYDAIAPIVEADSLDKECMFESVGDGRGEDYLNCPLNKEEYLSFWTELKNAGRVELKNFEPERLFEGCLPVEIMARRGPDVLRHGPMKPFGEVKGRKPYAVLQLRKENTQGDMYNMVGFQTNLTIPEQKRVFCMIPALKNAKFMRFGAMHRNSYINAPKVLNRHFCLKNRQNIFFAGQISGVEGYVESVASGLLCGINMLQYINGREFIDFGVRTALGALGNYLECASEYNFQPMHINWGLLAPIDAPKEKRRALMAQRALEQIEIFKERIWKK